MRSMHCSMTAFDLFRTKLLFAFAWAGTFATFAWVLRSLLHGPYAPAIVLTLIGIAFGYVVGYRWGVSPLFRTVEDVPQQDP